MSKLAQNSNAPRSQGDYITQVSEEIEGRVTKKLSQEFSRTENRILGALARLDNFLMNPLLQGHSGTAPETSRNVFSVNQGTIEDDSQSDPHPKAGTFDNQAMRNVGQELCSDDNTGTLSSVLHNNKNLCLLYFHFSYFYLFLAGNITVYPPSQGTNREKYFVYHYIKVRNADSGGK